MDIAFIGANEVHAGITEIDSKANGAWNVAIYMEAVLKGTVQRHHHNRCLAE